MLTPGNQPITKDISQQVFNFTAGFTITWQAYSNNLMPKPYQDACFNYKSQEVMSRGDCIEKCLVNLFHSKTNGTRIPAGVQVLKDDPNNNNKTFINMVELSFKTKQLTLKRMQKH